jgi:potassium efflux system protein
VGVSYDADPDQVRDILLAAAGHLPQVLKTPAPRVSFVRFGDSALEFELRCVIDDVRQALAVKSDLHFAILRQFREAGIEIPYPQREVRVRDDSAENPIEIRKPSRDKPASGGA